MSSPIPLRSQTLPRSRPNAALAFAILAIINVHDSWQCASKVGELVYHLQSLTFHCNVGLLVRLARCWLINHLGLFDADCEVIAVTGDRYFIYTFLHLPSCWSTSSTSVCTLDLACCLLRLKASNQSDTLHHHCNHLRKQLWAWQRTSCWTEMGLLHSLAWHHLSQGMDQKTHHHFGPVQAYHRGTASQLLWTWSDSQTLP